MAETDNKGNVGKNPPAKHGWWHEAFLTKLAETRSVTAACKSVGIGRNAAYNLREKDDQFRERWDEIVQATIDDVESTMIRLAIEGNTRPLLYKGQPVWLTDPTTGKLVLNAAGQPTPILVRDYYPAFNIFLVKAWRRERYFLERMLALDEASAAAKIDKFRALLEERTRVVPPAPPPDVTDNGA